MSRAIGPNVTIWYGILSGWLCAGLAGEYAVVIIVFIGILSVIADYFVQSTPPGEG